MKTILVLGSNFAGVTAALDLRRKIGKEHNITVISPTEQFLYVPSLIWVPFGKRRVDDITFNIRKVLEKKGVNFLKDKAVRIEPDTNEVVTEQHGTLTYDYVVAATGTAFNYDILPHLDPAEGYVNGIATPKLAEQAYEKFLELEQDPGPVVVGATQGASCMGAAYEYLFNLDKQLRKRGLRKKVKITWITPEPFLGHFGIGGITGGQKMLEMFMKMYDIEWKTNVAIDRIEKEKLVLKDGSELPYKMAMLMPPFIGSEVMRNSPQLVDEKGFVETNEGYQHITYHNVFAAGLAVQVKAPFGKCEVPFGVPKTGYPSDIMGKIVADNIRNDMKGNGKLRKQAFGKIPGVCVMDAGSKEVFIFTNHLFKPRQFEIMIPNIFNDFGKIILEKYMMHKNRKGLSFLP